MTTSLKLLTALLEYLDYFASIVGLIGRGKLGRGLDSPIFTLCGLYKRMQSIGTNCYTLWKLEQILRDALKLANPLI